MSKPLELVIYPKLERPMTGAEIMPYREQWQREAALSQTKHLTDAELAAEFESCRCDYLIQQATGSYWTPLGDTWPNDHESVGRRTSTLLRFATLPHYDEVDQ
jgi:hypothetical protein